MDCGLKRPGQPPRVGKWTRRTKSDGMSGPRGAVKRHTVYHPHRNKGRHLLHALAPTIPEEVGRRRNRSDGGVTSGGSQAGSSRSSLATWPVARTLYMALTILPSGPTRNVERITPWTVRP